MSPVGIEYSMPHVQDERLNHCSVGAGGIPYTIFNVNNIEHEIKHPEKTLHFLHAGKFFLKKMDIGHTFIHRYLK